MADHVRGVIDFMGKPVPLYDFRSRLGEPSIRQDMEDLVELLMARKQDHLNWIAKLKDCVSTGTEIKLATNPMRINLASSSIVPTSAVTLHVVGSTKLVASLVAHRLMSA